jgi:hypothetical protein
MSFMTKSFKIVVTMAPTRARAPKIAMARVALSQSVQGNNLFCVDTNYCKQNTIYLDKCCVYDIYTKCCIYNVYIQNAVYTMFI